MTMEQQQNLSLMVLSLLVALLILLFIISDREGEMQLTVPIEYANLPAGLTLKPQAPAHADIVVTGPQIMLYRFRVGKPTVHLDMHGALAGSVRVQGLQTYLQVPPEVRVRAVIPQEVAFTVLPSEQKKPD